MIFIIIPEDCPAREKCGWLGDAQVQLSWYLYLYYGDLRILKEHNQGMKDWVENLKKKPNVIHFIIILSYN
jgi:hypothetical protein